MAYLMIGASYFALIVATILFMEGTDGDDVRRAYRERGTIRFLISLMVAVVAWPYLLISAYLRTRQESDK